MHHHRYRHDHQDYPRSWWWEGGEGDRNGDGEEEGEERNMFLFDVDAPGVILIQNDKEEEVRFDRRCTHRYASLLLPTITPLPTKTSSLPYHAEDVVDALNRALPQSTLKAFLVAANTLQGVR